ncbi:MAG: MinD/ParA family protein [Candidatus Brocadiia bacterium]
MNEEATRPRIIVVTSGKGGVGKTNMAANLAVSLRLFGVQVMLLDADMGLGNVDVLLGLNVRHDLRDVLLHGRRLDQVVIEGPRGVKILPGASGVEEMTRLSDQKVQQFLADLQRYCAGMDYLVVDTAPGISPSVVNCLLAADEIVLVTNPEPMAVTDAYALLKVLSSRSSGAEKPVFVVMNQTGSREEAVRSFDRLRLAAERFLGRAVEYLGSVAWDDAVGQATRRQVDFLTHFSEADCSRDVRKLAARLVSSGKGGEQDMGRFFRNIMEPSDG